MNPAYLQVVDTPAHTELLRVEGFPAYKDQPPSLWVCLYRDLDYSDYCAAIDYDTKRKRWYRFYGYDRNPIPVIIGAIRSDIDRYHGGAERLAHYLGLSKVRQAIRVLAGYAITGELSEEVPQPPQPINEYNDWPGDVAARDTF